MINYLKGILASKIEDGPFGCNITVEAGSIGYLVITHKKTVASLPEEGKTVTIYTSLIHREDSMTLYGFKTREERDLFNILQSVSGIGAKAALLMTGELGPYNLVNAVISGDVKAISKTKGIGPKLAQRVILELKEKMTSWREKTSLTPSEILPGEEYIPVTESYTEAETVLLSLGYTKKESEEALKFAMNAVQNQNDSEELLRQALQRLATKEGLSV